MKDRLILDTNNLISAFFWEHSNEGKVFDEITEKYTLVFSEETFQELEDVIFRPKFEKYLRVSARWEFLEALREKAYWVKPTRKITVCRDPKDNKFLEAGSSGYAKQIITGDQDLLILNPFEEIEILTARDYLGKSDVF